MGSGPGGLDSSLVHVPNESWLAFLELMVGQKSTPLTRPEHPMSQVASQVTYGLDPDLACKPALFLTQVA